VPEPLSRLIYETALLLDAEDFPGFLNRCAEDFRYVIHAHSPELGKKMIWLEHDRKGMHDMFLMLNQHVRVKGHFKRHVSVYTIDSVGPNVSRVHTSLMLIHTNPDGVSSLFAAGHYIDVIRSEEGVHSLRERNVVLDTRDLSPGIHIPI